MVRPTLVPGLVTPPLRLSSAARLYGRKYSVRVSGKQPSPPIRTVADLKAWLPGTNVPDVEVCGWVRSVRKSSGVRFVDVTDGSSMRPVQAVVEKALAIEYDAPAPAPRAVYASRC